MKIINVVIISLQLTSLTCIINDLLLILNNNTSFCQALVESPALAYRKPNNLKQLLTHYTGCVEMGTKSC